MQQKKYHSAFMRVNVTKDGGETIQKLQQEFDRFWKKMSRVADKCPEKFHALKSMQEACMWLTRACALSNTEDDTTPAPAMRVLNVKGKEENFKNTPTIVVKKKKV